MTKISKKSAYPIKKPIKTDYFVGTDSEQLGKTVSFSFDGATKVINELNGNSPIKYIFKTSDNIGLSVLEEGEFLSSSNETNISGITKLYINKFNKDVTNLSVLYDYLLVNNSDFLFKLQGTNPNVYVYFNLTSIENYSDYYVFNVSVYKENVAFASLVYFGEYFFNFELKSTGDSDPLNLVDRVVALENQTDVSNVFVEMQIFSFVDNVATVFSGWIWKLLGEIYTNPININFTIPYSAAGKTRIEYIVPNNTNGFTRIIGEETFGTAQAPQLPEHGLYVTFFIVTDSSIGIPESPNIKNIPTIQQVLEIGRATTKNIWFFNNSNSKCLSVSSESILFQKLESVFNFIRADNTTETYATQLPNKLGGAEQTFAMMSDLTNKVDKITGKGLSTEDYTTSEKNKLASIDATHYLPPLQTTVQLSDLPQAGISDKARVYVEADLSDYFYDTTATSGDIEPDDQTGGIGFWRKVAVGGETAASIMTKYESNADRNAFTDALKAKLDSITEIFTTALKTNYDSAYAWISTNGATVLAHISSTHAPSNAQKNSDITKAEIEAKLTGEITTHTHQRTDVISLAMSDTSTALVTGDTDSMNAPYNFTLLNYWVGVKTAPTVSGITVDVKKNGVSITSTKAGIDATEKTSLTGTTPVLTATTFVKGDEITPNIFTVGSGETGKALKLYLEIIKT